MPLYESEGTWFAAEEVAKRAAAARRFNVGDRVKYSPSHLGGVAWFGTVDTVYEGGRSYLIRFEHDRTLRGRYYAEELEAVPSLGRASFRGIEFPLLRRPDDRLRDLHAKLDRRGVDAQQAMHCLQEYHALVGELLAQPARSEAQVAAEIADRLEADGFRYPALCVRTMQIPERR